MYTGYDDDEFDENGGAKSVLKKYDEDIEGKEEGGFRLGGPAPVKKEGAAGKGKAREDEPERERVKLSLDYTSEPPPLLYVLTTETDPPFHSRDLHDRLPPGGRGWLQEAQGANLPSSSPFSFDD